MEQARHDCLIPSEMIPKCPVCGGNMMMYLRSDQYFVEDENWHEAAGRYYDFMQKMKNKKAVLLELGVGFNTPAIIKFVFHRLTKNNRHLTYICVNKGEAYAPKEIADRSIAINADAGEVIKSLQGQA